MTDQEQGLRRLAAFAAATSYDDLPATAREAARVLVLDTIGVVLAGSGHAEMQRLYSRLPGGSEAQFLSRGLARSSAPSAAFANATAGSFLELDQGERPTGHPALHALPALLAHGQSRHVSGRDLLTAFVIAYEIQSRIQRSYTLRWPVHPHGTLGTPAAAAGLGKLDGCSGDELAALINCGASLVSATSWNSCLEGATVRNAFAGLTAQAAFLARTLAASGFTAADNAVADTFGEVLGVERDPRGFSHDLGAAFAVEDGYVKFHAACALVHPALDAVLDAAGAVPCPAQFPPFRLGRTFVPAEVTRVAVRTTERASRLASQAADTELAAKFSIPVSVATLLVHGTSEPGSFQGEKLHDRRVAELAQKVVVEADRTFDAAWPAEFRTEVTIALADGTTLEGECLNPYGSGANQASIADIRAKFETLVQPVVGSGQSVAAWEIGVKLDACEDVDSWLDECFGSDAAVGT